jgi:hypothetical protein
MSNDVKNWTPEQERFIAWLALPKAQRTPKTQQALAKEIDIASETLTRWKSLPGFMDAVNALARELVKHDVAEVLGKIRAEAKKGNLPFVNMVLSMAGMTKDVESAGKGPAQGVTIREVVVERPVRDPE